MGELQYLAWRIALGAIFAILIPLISHNNRYPTRYLDTLRVRGRLKSDATHLDTLRADIYRISVLLIGFALGAVGLGAEVRDAILISLMHLTPSTFYQGS